MKNLIILYIILLSSFHSSAQLVIANQGGTATAIVSSMVGGGLTVSNATITCPSIAYGTFTNGASTNLGIPSGIVLTTGNVNTLNGPGSNFWSVDNPGGACNDAQLGALESSANNDCCILEFDVVPSCTTLRIRFVFGSEEYPEYVNLNFNDAFGFFVTGQNPGGGNYNNTNVATLPNNTTIVSIDNVNANLNSAYYVNNSTGTSIVLDAFTTVITRDVAVVPCQSYHFKLAIADATDNIYDSGVFIDFLDCVNTVASTNTTTPASCAGNDGTATANVSAGYPPYTYSWNTTPPQTTPTATGLTPGIYTVTIDDAGACTPPLIQTVTVSSNASVPTLSINSTSICTGQSATLTATPSAAGGTFLWSPGGQTTQSITVSPSSTTTYSCVYNLSGCNANGSGTVTVNSIPSINVTSPIICAGQSATVTSTPSATGGTYSWSPGGQTTQNITVSPTTTTNHSVIYTLNGCSSSPVSATVTVNPTPSITATSSTICLGQSATLTSTASVSGGTYSWSPGGLTTQNITVSPSTTTNYSVIYSLNGCSSAPASASVTVNPIPTVTVSSSTICSGQSATLTATPSSGSGSYSWSTNGSTQSVIVSPSTTNSYTVTYTLNGCSSLPGTGTVTINPVPTVSVNSVSICSGESATVTATPNLSGGTVIWSPGGETTNSITISPSSTTSYSVVYSLNGCNSNSASGTVTVNEIPTVSILENPTICQGQSATLTALPSTTGGTYLWTPGNSTTNPVSISPSATTVYAVVYTLNGCVSAPANSTVTVNPNVPVDAGQNVSICLGGSVTLTASGTPTVSWPNGIQDGQAFNPTTSGTYVVTGTSANGCVTTDSVIVTVNSLPVITAGTPQTVCVGQQVTLSGSGAGAGGTYSWSNGIQDNVPFSVNGTITYTVTGTDANGCSSQGQVTVTSLPLPIANFSPDVTTGAIPLTVNFTNTSSNANTFTWDFGNGNGLNTSNLASTTTTYTEIGVYTVWLNASNGYCEDSTSAIININLPPWIFVPNVFTPNTDGSNETWMVQTENMASIDLIILNRWGNVMAKIEDLNGGWDGKTSDGSDATAGTYFYNYEAKALNGEEFSGHGFLTLIR